MLIRNPLIACLHLLPPETAHDVTLALLKTQLFPAVREEDDHVLAQNLWGRRFANPVGLSAGFDKNAEVVVPLLNLGFGFVEAGTVTPVAQPGNPRPRLFRWPEQRAVVNRLGFNNKGLHAYCDNLRAIKQDAVRLKGIVGGNVGRNKNSADGIADYVTGIKAVSPLVDYVVINISSPNTPGLRGLQNRDELQALLKAAQETRAGLHNPPPLLVKIAPNLDDDACAAIADVAMNAGVDGLIISNTTVARPADMPPSLANEAGGLSGLPVFAASNAILRKMAVLTGGKMPLIGVGGIASAEDAYAKIRLGASLVQLYTGLIYQGPGLVADIKKGLARLLKRDGFASISDAVGADIRP